MSRPPNLSLSTGGGDFGRPMELEASSESLDLASSFTLSASGTFAKEDFVINKSGIAAINHTEVRRTGLQLQDLEFFEVLGKGASSLVRRAVHKPSQAQLAVKIINVFDKGKRDQLLRELHTLYSSQNYPWLVAFAFGLLHGLGFAGALSEIGVPQHEVPLALLMFNVGVESGQLLPVRLGLQSVF